MMYAGSKNSLVKEGQFTKVRQFFIFLDSLFYAKNRCLSCELWTR